MFLGLVLLFLATAAPVRRLLDHVVDMHDQYLMDRCRRAHNAFEEQPRQFRRKGRPQIVLEQAALLSEEWAVK